MKSRNVSPQKSAGPANSSLAWFQEARFGMSIHWGLYSIPARGEWVRSAERMSVADYQPFFESFSPEPHCCEKWAKLAKQAGMKYGVLTTKHHDGFCLFDSKLTDYKSTNTPARRDFVREYVDAFRAEGLGIGLYYSLLDWHHPDYPAFGDQQHPLRSEPSARERDAKCDWPRYVSYMRGQVEELLSHYGKIDIMVFDFSYWDYMGEKWGGTDLIRTAKRLQPGILVNDRLGQEPIKKIPRPSYAGDYHQCEQGISSAEVRDDGGNPLPWEAWFTTNNSWCFSPNDRQYKSPGDIIRAMINCVSKNANIVVNIGPDGRGNVDPESMRLLLEVGEWMALNGESVYGCGSADLPKPEWGRFTQKGRYLYAHLLDTVIGQIPMQGLRGRVKNGRVLANGAEAVICDFWNPALQTLDGPDDIFFNFGTPPQNTFPYPDFRDTVVRFELTDAAERRMLVENYRLKLEAQRKRRTPPN